jgi:hypothetical protein
MVSYAIDYNVRRYVLLRGQSALCLPVRNGVKAGSSYHKVTKSETHRKTAASNGLYTLLAVFILMILSYLSSLGFYFQVC